MQSKEKELSRYLKRKLEVKEADFDLKLHMKDVAGNEVQPQQQLSSSFENRPPEVFDLPYETCGNAGDTDINIEASNTIVMRLSNAGFKDHLRILKLLTGSAVEEMTSAAKCAEKYEKLIQPTKKIFVNNEKDCDTVLKTGADVLSIKQQNHYLLESGAAKWFDNKQNCDGKTRGDIQIGDLYRDKLSR
ncbi:hypothetical protein OUZ56_030049 [Daphnia magna]|uniref:Uncharacterized protein n=1 Tax=Daphnia magna TaxID=35525 RepID=A0ABQ9ZQ59_9CRUS|nr:hypothetical protein OUZ56_030049 [Daphnia magna]